MYSFPAPVLRLENQLRQHFIPIPVDIAEELESCGTGRILATINGLVVRRAILRNKDGERYFFLNLAMMREIKVSLGDIVLVDLETDPNPDYIFLGEEFETVLAQDQEASDRYFSMTLGQRRGLAYHVTSAKRVETRIKRAFDIAHKLRTYTLHYDVEKE